MGSERRERVCVTAAGGFIGSSLVRNLLENGYFVNATCRDLGNAAKTSHLLSLPGAKERLTLFKADLFEQGSFDSAIDDCDFVINLATSLDYSKDPQTGFIQPCIDGTLDILRACKKAKTVKRVIHISSITAASPLNDKGELKDSLDETCWTPVDYIKSTKPLYWMYYVAKTLAEQAALQYGSDHQMEVVTLLPGLVAGSCLTPAISTSILMALTPMTGDRACYEALVSLQALVGSVSLVHVEDVCHALTMLMHHPSAEGRYVCSAEAVTIKELAGFFHKRYPQIPPALNLGEEEEGVKRGAAVPIPSNKLSDLGFFYRYGLEQMVDDSVGCPQEMQVL